MLASGWFNSDSEDIGELVSAKMSWDAIPLARIPVSSSLFVSPLYTGFIERDKDKLIIMVLLPMLASTTIYSIAQYQKKCYFIS